MVSSSSPATRRHGVKEIVDRTVAADRGRPEGQPELIVEQFGDASADEKFRRSSTSDLAKAESLSLPVTLIVLLIAFGTLVAAGLPLLLAITAVLGTMGLIGPLSQISPVEESIKNVILLIGLAVGVDYALFYLRRVREERAAGRDADAALRGRRGDVGPRRARLGHDRHGRRWQACTSPARRRSLAWRRHDRRRRRRDARLAHGASRAAVQAR